jgi:hypothetical protein
MLYIYIYIYIYICFTMGNTDRARLTRRRSIPLAYLSQNPVLREAYMENSTGVAWKQKARWLLRSLTSVIDTAWVEFACTTHCWAVGPGCGRSGGQNLCVLLWLHMVYKKTSPCGPPRRMLLRVEPSDITLPPLDRQWTVLAHPH